MASQPTRFGYDSIGNYNNLWTNKKDDDSTERKEKYTTLVNQYYDLTTDFYEWGWGTSFHFAPRFKNEAVAASIARHEHFLALRLGLKPGMKVLDVGCGVCGPMMEIARFSGATVIGINNNAYQVSRGEKLIKANGLSSICSAVKGDFMNTPFPDNYFDCCYGIEAICHAPDKLAIYNELKRVLKPGGKFACYEWCLTDKFDHKNKDHKKIKEDIEVGDGLPDIDSIKEVLKCLSEAGFIIEESKDIAQPDNINPVPWYEALSPSFTSFNGLRVTWLGITITHAALNFFEKLRILSAGTTSTHTILIRAHSGLVKGGKLDIFTPMFYFLAQKPDSKSKGKLME